jgi:hypothetical protein
MTTEGPQTRAIASIILSVVSLGSVWYLNYGIPSQNLNRYLKQPAFEIPNFLKNKPHQTFVAQYSPAFVTAIDAVPDPIPVELLIARVFDENEMRSIKHDWQDSIALCINNFFYDMGLEGHAIDASLGPGQVNISTAQMLDRKYLGNSFSSKDTTDRLLDPVTNIGYVTQYTHHLLYRDNRIGETLHPDDVLKDPHLLAVIGNEYVIGETETPLAEAVGHEIGASYLETLADIEVQLLNLSFGTYQLSPEKAAAMDAYRSNDAPTSVGTASQ